MRRCEYAMTKKEKKNVIDVSLQFRGWRGFSEKSSMVSFYFVKMFFSSPSPGRRDLSPHNPDERTNRMNTIRSPNTPQQQALPPGFQYRPNLMADFATSRQLHAEQQQQHEARQQFEQGQAGMLQQQQQLDPRYMQFYSPYVYLPQGMALPPGMTLPQGYAPMPLTPEYLESLAAAGFGTQMGMPSVSQGNLVAQMRGGQSVAMPPQRSIILGTGRPGRIIYFYYQYKAKSLSWNRDVPMASQRGQILLAVFLFDARFPIRLATVSPQAPFQLRDFSSHSFFVFIFEFLNFYFNNFYFNNFYFNNFFKKIFNLKKKQTILSILKGNSSCWIKKNVSFESSGSNELWPKTDFYRKKGKLDSITRQMGYNLASWLEMAKNVASNSGSRPKTYKTLIWIHWIFSQYIRVDKKMINQ